MIAFAVLLLCVGASVAQAPPAFECIEDGFFPDPRQCDKYYECRRGRVEEKLCPDGLVFDHNQPPEIESCDYKFHIDCVGELQPSQGRGVCYEANGVFEHEDPSNCADYYECVDNTPRLQSCHDGLHFLEATGTCEWAHSSGRTNCQKKMKQLDSGFICDTNVTQTLLNGHQLLHTRFPVLSDCRQFITCLNGDVPMEGGCPEGQVFNDVALVCDAPENVPGCELYYENPADGQQA